VVVLVVQLVVQLRVLQHLLALLLVDDQEHVASIAEEKRRQQKDDPQSEHLYWPVLGNLLNCSVSARRVAFGELQL
jgi:hypothetical protein